MNILNRLWQSVQAFGYPLRSDDAAVAGRAKRRAGNSRGNAFEQMEPRLLLTTMNATAGGFSQTFVDSVSNKFTVTFTGAVTDQVELIFINAAGQLCDYVAPADGQPGMDLFAVIVTSSSLDTVLTFDGAYTGTDGKLTGNVGQAGSNLWDVTDKDDYMPVDAPSGTGSVYIGRRQKVSDSYKNIPHINASTINGLNAAGQTALGRTRTLLNTISPGTYLNTTYTAGVYVLEDGQPDAEGIGRILIDGTVTGNVYIEGSIDTFYCGWLITGDIGSAGKASSLFNDDNFYVAGDIANLWVKTSIGTNETGSFPLSDPPYYNTHVDIHVGGQIGNIRAGNVFLGSVTADNRADAPSLPSGWALTEVGTWRQRSDLNNTIGAFRDGYLLLTSTAFSDLSNNNITNPIYLGTLTSDAAQTVEGELDNSPGDYKNELDSYAVGLTAGQSIKLTMTTAAGFAWGIMDAEGRIVAEAIGNGTLRFTAKEAGVYRIIIAMALDTKLDGSADALGFGTYSFTITGLGSVAIGGIGADNDIVIDTNTYPAVGDADNPDSEIHSGIVAVRGNIGVIATKGDLFGLIGSSASASGNTASLSVNHITTLNGNLNAVVASSMGRLVTAQRTLSNAVGISTTGTVGSIRATGTNRTDDENSDVLGVYVVSTGNIQLIDGKAEVGGKYFTKKAIGVVRAGQLTLGTAQTQFSADYDNTGRDGIIDLIDVVGDFGINGKGGPRITTGIGGNVRFIHISDTSNVFQDTTYHTGDTGANGGIEYYGGETIPPLTDDSGASITLTPTSPSIDPDDLVMTVWTYTVNGYGGVVVLRVVSNYSLTVTATGNTNNKQAAEIGELVINGAGSALVQNGTTGTYVNPPATTTTTVTLPGGGTTTTTVNNSFNNLNLNGSIRVDVFEVSSSGVINNITNSTAGDIVNINTGGGDIGTITLSGSLGLTSSTTGNELNQILVINNSFPFTNLHNGVIAGDIGSIRVGKAIGAMVISSAGTIIANYGDVDDSSIREGINAPIVVSGNLGAIDIGEGLAASGVGYNPISGIFVGGKLGSLYGLNADIRSDIIASKGIGSIVLDGGSIVGSLIGVLTTFDQAQRFNNEFTFDNAVDANNRPGTTSNPVYEIGSITINGNGGIIGTRFYASDINVVTVNDAGFGIAESYFWTSASGVLNSIYAGGWGLVAVTIDAYKINNIQTMSKTSSALDLTQYASNVRLSEQYVVDPFTDQEVATENPNHIGYYTDLELLYDVVFANYLNALARPAYTGSILLCNIDAQIIGKINSYGIEGSNIYIGDSLTSLTVTQDLAYGHIQTGAAALVSVGNDVINSNFIAAGKIGTFTVSGDFNSDSLLFIKGGSGSANVVTFKGDFDGELLAAGKIANLSFGTAGTKNTAGTGEFNGTLELVGDQAAGNINFYGTVEAGSVILIKGAVSGWLSFAGGLGGDLTVSGDVGGIKVGADLNAATSGVDGDITIAGNLSALIVRGAMTDNCALNVAGNLGTLTLNGAEGETDLLDGSVIVGGTIGTINVNGFGDIDGGSLTGYIQAVKSIGTINVVNGDIASTAVIKSLMAGITSIVVTNGNLDGTISALGAIASIELRKPSAKVIARDYGSLNGDISAASLSKLIVLSDVESSASLTITGLLSNVNITGSVADNASITAGSLSKFNVMGDFNGDLTLNKKGVANALTIKGNLGNTVALSQTLTVAGSLTLSLATGGFGANSSLLVGGNLTALTMAKGDLAGNIMVNGVISRISAATMTGAVITSGSDITSILLTGAMSNSLIQAGITRGANGTLATGTNQMANIGTISVGGLVNTPSVTDSVIAAGGNIKSFIAKGIMSGSSVSSGLVYSAAGIQGVINDASPLATAIERETLRSGGTLYRGDITSLIVNGGKAGGLINGSAITAGISAGVDGQFGTVDDSADSVTGGTSVLKSVKALIPALDTSVILAESPSTRSVNGSDQPGKTAYTITPTGALVPPTSQKGSVYTYEFGTETLTITVGKNTVVKVYDDPATAGIVDTIVISTTTAAAGSVTISVSDPDALQIGRVLAEDDTNLGTFVFNGDIVGVSDPAVPAVRIDSNMTKFQVRGIAGDADWVGMIGGDVGTLSITNQGDGALIIGGAVKALTVVNGTATGAQGIVANSFGAITLGSLDTVVNSYNGRIESRAVGMIGISSITIRGAATSLFQGDIVAAGSIGIITAKFAGLDGSITVAGDAKAITFTKGGTALGSTISVGGTVAALTVGGTLVGNVSAGSITKFSVTGDQDTNSTVTVVSDIGTMTIGGSLAGQLSAGSLGTGTITGLLANTVAKRIHIAGDVTRGLNLNGGTAAGSLVMVDGKIASLIVKGTHSGTVATGVGGNVTSAQFVNVTGGLLVVGGDLLAVSASGAVTNALFSAGVFIGADGLYNSNDDVVYGGNINKGTFKGEYKDSVIAAGVLPKNTGVFGLPSDRRNYSGDSRLDADIDDVDPAQTGGITRSAVGLITFSKRLVDTSPDQGVMSVVVAADALVAPIHKGSLKTQIIGNPSNSLTAISATRTDTNKIEVIFDQPIDTSSISNLSVQVLDSADVNYAGVTFRYEVRDATSDTRDNDYVLIITAAADTDFNGTTLLPDKVVLQGGVSGDVIMNHAGARSAKLIDMDADGTPDYQPFSDVTLTVA